MAFSGDALACVSDLLTRRIQITELDRRVHPPRGHIESSVVDSYRLILVRSGVVHYALENWVERVGVGTLLLVPAWMKRGWRAGPRTRLSMHWVSFNPVGETIYQDRPFAWKSDDAARDARALARMRAAWRSGAAAPAEVLAIEGELKALLGRLACGCAAREEGSERPAPSSLVREIAVVAEWIKQNHAMPDVLSRAAALIRSNDHYFRMRFRERTGFTLGQYTAMIRMRRARYLLSSTAAPVKDVAWQVGFRDPLHFSRCYRKFWNHSPRAERT